MDFLAHMAVTWMMIASQNQQSHLVGGFNPLEKYARQIGSFPQVRLIIKKYLKPPPSHLIFQVEGFAQPSHFGGKLCRGKWQLHGSSMMTNQAASWESKGNTPQCHASQEICVLKGFLRDDGRH